MPQDALGGHTGAFILDMGRMLLHGMASDVPYTAQVMQVRAGPSACAGRALWSSGEHGVHDLRFVGHCCA